MNDRETVVLYDEKNNKIEFEVLGVVTEEKQDYAILHPIREGQTTDNTAYIFRIDNDESGNEILTEVEDDGEFEKVKNAWETAIEGDFIVVDEDDEK